MCVRVTTFLTVYPQNFYLLPMPHPDIRTRIPKLKSANHSFARKVVERVFGVLLRRFRNFYCPFRVQNLEETDFILNSCCNLTSVATEDRGYEVPIIFRHQLSEDVGVGMMPKQVLCVEC